MDSFSAAARPEPAVALQEAADFSQLAAQNVLLRAEIDRLLNDRETLKQAVGIMVEMSGLAVQ